MFFSDVAFANTKNTQMNVCIVKRYVKKASLPVISVDAPAVVDGVALPLLPPTAKVQVIAEESTCL